jgi:hypothetical protein
MGADIRKENVTPKGTPAVTNPIKRGTAEQVQKGVTTPRRDARIFPTNSFFPINIRRVCWGVKKVRIIPTPKTTRTKSINTLGESYIKNSTADAKRVPALNRKTS